MTTSARLAFAIPFKPKDACADWDDAQAKLRQTVRSIEAAAAPRDVVVAVACHEQPDLGEPARDDVVVLRAPFAPPADHHEAARDKARKRRLIGAWLRDALVRDEVYVMFIDADDLLHRATVATCSAKATEATWSTTATSSTSRPA